MQIRVVCAAANASGTEVPERREQSNPLGQESGREVLEEGFTER